MGKFKSLLTGLALGTLIGSLIDPARRAKVKKIAEELKTKVGNRAKTISDLSKDAYENLVDAAVEEYHEVKSVPKEDMDKIVSELKAGWKEIKASLKK